MSKKLVKEDLIPADAVWISLRHERLRLTEEKGRFAAQGERRSNMDEYEDCI